MKEKYKNNKKWKNYARRAQKNPYVKEFIFAKYNGICQYCGLPVKDNFQIHHMNYDNECVTEETIKFPNPTSMRPNRIRNLPDCEHCNNFENCITKNLSLVHPYCNFLIEQEYQNNKNSEVKLCGN